ncbi:bifunctional diguanylate cyclase/phosphodiesterase, partial [Frankia canadensis]|uniref:bifunctional diguanylate cyclase/phosphodiesterase n=1 Tax=Frankia canadensis TaxID=1836972 RepID=UPI001FAFE285
MARTARSAPRRRLPRLRLPAGLAAVVLLGSVALALGRDLLAREEAARIEARVQLVHQLAAWESDTAGPSVLASAVRDLPLDPGDPAGNAELLPRLTISVQGDVYEPVVLMDARGTVTAAYPPGVGVVPGQLGAAWASAWAGRGAMSPTFGDPRRPGDPEARRRATVVPVGPPGQVWAVLVAVSADQVHYQLTDGVAAMLGAGTGTVSTIDPNGVVATSTDGPLVGRALPAADQPPRPPTAVPLVWHTTGPGGQVTHICAAADNGYRVCFQQRTASLHADLRARGDRRNLTLLAVAVTAVLSIAFVVLLRETSACRSQARLRALFAAAHDIVLVTDPTGRLTFASPALSPLLGHPPDGWPGRPVTDLVHAEDASRLLRLIADPGLGSLLNVRLVGPDGAARWFDVAARQLPTADGSLEILITCHVVGHRKRLLDQLGHQADHDLLTGLLNRSAFTARLDAALAALAGTDPGDPHAPRAPIAVLFIDLDRFKPVNDTYGHAAGDRVLQVVGERIRDRLGAADVSGRLGGDEFGILLTQTDEPAARALAAQLIDAVSQPVVVTDDATVRVAASVGVALARTRQCGADWLLHGADQAMYWAKRSGPGRYAVAPPVEPTTGRGWGDQPVPSEPAALGFTVVQPPPSDPGRRTTAPGRRTTASAHAHAPAAMPAGPDTRAAPAIPTCAAVPPSAPPATPALSAPPAPPAPSAPSAPSALSALSARATRPGGDPSRRATRRQLARQQVAHARVQLVRALPLLVIGTIVLTTTMITIEIENSNRRRAESQRTADTHALAERLANRTASLSQPRSLIDLVSRLPWSLTDRATDDRIVRSLAGPQFATPDTLLTLVDLDGRPLAASRPGLPIPVGSPLWASARGSGLNVPTFGESGNLHLLSLVPVRRGQATVAFLVVGRPMNHLPTDAMAEAFQGAVGESSLGIVITIVDGQGRVVMSSEPDLGGRVLIDQRDLHGIQPGRSQRVTLRENGGGGRVAAAAMIPTAPMPAYVVLQQDPSAAREGPRPGHLPGDLLVGLLVLATGTGLLWALLREDRTTRREGARLQTLLHESHDIILCVNRAGYLNFVSSAVESLLGYPVDELFGRPLLGLIHPDDQPTTRAFLAAQQHGGPTSLLDVRMRAADGRFWWFDVEAGGSQHVHGPGYLDGGLLLTCHEVGERRRLQEQLRERATHDPLTGLRNRVALADRLDQLARARTPFTILLIDLDEFKPVNDAYGHQAGDEVLRVIAARLATVTRTLVDTPGAEVGGLGGGA